MSNRAVLLIGALDHCRKEWEDLSSLVTLKVRQLACNGHSTTSREVGKAGGPLLVPVWVADTSVYRNTLQAHEKISRNSAEAVNTMMLSLSTARIPQHRYVLVKQAYIDRVDIVWTLAMSSA